jgi:hypothetical protein
MIYDIVRFLEFIDADVNINSYYFNNNKKKD